jgi:hypothetical protein
MKSVVFALLAVGLLTFGSNVLARNAWGPVVSYWDTSDESDDIGFGAFFSFDIAPNVAFDLRGTWFSDMSDSERIDLEVIPIEAGISLFGNLGDITRLHLGGGLGYYLISADVDGVFDREYDPDDEIGGYISAGLETTIVDNLYEGLLAQGITIFVDAGYRFVDISDTGGLRRDGGTLDGLMVNAGIRFLW